MPRQARIVVPGELYHVTQRGNYQQDIFKENQDRILYLKYLQESSAQWNLLVYAFCLMGNHVHLIVKPLFRESLARVLGVAHMRYTQYFNSKYKLKGHLWQGRFYSDLLQDIHIIQAVRYVERNPVRAGLVKAPWEYVWSSAQAHLGKKYNVIKLADIKEYIDVSSWKDFISVEDFVERST